MRHDVPRPSPPRHLSSADATDTGRRSARRTPAVRTPSWSHPVPRKRVRTPVSARHAAVQPAGRLRSRRPVRRRPAHGHVRSRASPVPPPPGARSRASCCGRPWPGSRSSCLAVPFVLPPSYAARQAVYAWEDLPTELPLDAELPQRSVMTDAQRPHHRGVLRPEPGPVTLAQVSPHVVDALLATEDDRFYEHGAVDLPALARAVLRNRSTGSVQGGSGITQQYVKNLLLSQADQRPRTPSASPSRPSTASSASCGTPSSWRRSSPRTRSSSATSTR